MLENPLVGHLSAAFIAAMALGGLATYARLLPSSDALVASALTFALVVVAVAAGVVLGSRDQPNKTAYW
jgi:hypothetical protein